MRTFIQLRDGIAYATLITPTDSPDHTVTPDHTTAIEVFTDSPDQFLGKRYNESTKTWSDAPKLKYAVLNSDGFIIEIRETIFEHETELPNHQDWDGSISPSWKWNGTEWVDPAPAGPMVDLEALRAAHQAEAEILRANAITQEHHTH